MPHQNTHRSPKLLSKHRQTQQIGEKVATDRGGAVCGKRPPALLGPWQLRDDSSCYPNVSG